MAITDLLHLSGTGLQAYQQQISTYSNNIANVGTEGYSRRSAELEATVANGYGTGVRVGDVSRIYNTLGTSNLLKEQSNSSFHAGFTAYLSDLETLVGSGSGSLDASIRNFQNALQDAVASPEDMAARTTLLQRASSLSSEINRISDTLSATDSYWGTTNDLVQEVNTLTSQLQTLNANISKAEAAGRSVPELQDQRDMLVRDLAGKVNFSITPDYQISMGGQELVSADGLSRQDLTVDATNNFSVGGVDISASVSGGEIGALVAAQDSVAVMQTQIDALASTLITEANSIFDNAYNLQGVSPVEGGYSFFTGTTAADMALDAQLYDPNNPMAAQPELVALAGTRESAGPPPVPNAGDNTAGQNLFDMMHDSFASLGNQSPSEFWVNVESTLASVIQEEQQLTANSASIVQMLDGEMLSISGVNLDEELMNLMGAQKAYEAVARVMTTANSMLDTLINLGR